VTAPKGDSTLAVPILILRPRWREGRVGHCTDAVLRQRRALDEAINHDGSSKGLPPEQVPDEPGDCVVFETVRRFKGLEREVVILVEIPETAVRLDEVLYVGLIRATTQLAVIAGPGLARRLA
jgi:hypothetical protein